jgi:hypothetical protein
MSAAKKKREDYTQIWDGSFTFYGKLYHVKVLADLEQLVELQGHLALANKFKKNKQDYGPFRVTVTAIEDKPKEKRRKKQL